LKYIWPVESRTYRATNDFTNATAYQTVGGVSYGMLQVGVHNNKYSSGGELAGRPKNHSVTMETMTKQERIGVIGIGGILLLGLCSWLWWTNIRQNPNRVFWDMVSNNLATTGVTHISEQNAQGLSVSQYTQLSFGQHPKARALTVFKQNGNTLSTEQVSDSGADFVRYQQISLPHSNSKKKLNTGAVLGKWAKLQAGQNLGQQATSGLFQQSLLDILPIGNLSPEVRADMLRSMHQQGLFSYDVKLVKKDKVHGESVYMYAVSIKPDAYIRVMQQFESLVGASAYKSIKATDYKGQKPLSIVVAIDARSHDLSQVYDVARQRTERYEGFGIADTTPMPTASITTTQLTQRLAQLLQQ
jgi:hypothetical protein